MPQWFCFARLTKAAIQFTEKPKQKILEDIDIFMIIFPSTTAD
jgi:hypothetical protein